MAPHRALRWPRQGREHRRHCDVPGRYGVLSRRAVDLAFHVVDKTMQGLRRADSPRDCFVRRG